MWKKKYVYIYKKQKITRVISRCKTQSRQQYLCNFQNTARCARKATVFFYNDYTTLETSRRRARRKVTRFQLFRFSIHVSLYVDLFNSPSSPPLPLSTQKYKKKKDKGGTVCADTLSTCVACDRTIRALAKARDVPWVFFFLFFFFLKQRKLDAA